MFLCFQKVQKKDRKVESFIDSKHIENIQKQDYSSENWIYAQEFQNYLKLTNYERKCIEQYCNFYKIPIKYDLQQQYQNDYDGNTIAMFLSQQGKQIPKCFYHDPLLQNKQGYTVALIQSSNKKIPSKQWQHDKYLRAKYNQLQQSQNDMKLQEMYYTVQNFLQEFQIQVPQTWKYQLTNEAEDSQIIIDIQNKIPVNIKQQDYQYINKYGQSFAVKLAMNGIIPLNEILLKESKTNLHLIEQYLAQNQLPIPNVCYCNQYQYKQRSNDIFEQAIQKIIPQIQDHNPQEQNCDGFTIAMILAINNIEIPKEWYHEPNIVNKYGFTVAHYMSRNGKIPDEQWEHDRFLRTQLIYSLNENVIVQQYPMFTVQNFLQQRNIQIPQQWQYEVIDQNDNTLAMIQAYKKQHIDDQNIHDAHQTNLDGNTVAMILAQQKQEISYQWIHNSSLQNKQGNTVAMILAMNKQQVSKQWIHDSNIKNLQGYTVALIYAQNGISPNSIWNHDKYIRVKYQNNTVIPLYLTVQNLLYQKNIQVTDSWQYQNYLEYENSKLMFLAEKGILLNRHYINNDIQYQNIFGQNIAQILAKNNKIPPKQLIYNMFLVDSYNKSLIQYLQENHLPIPYKKQDNDIFYQAINGLIPNINGHKSNEQNEDGWTIAMILVKIQHRLPSQQWHHNPNIQNKYGQTVAMLLFENYQSILYEWEHDPKLQDYNGETIAIKFAKRKMFPPVQWQYKDEIRNIQGQTYQDILLQYNIKNN